MQIHQLIPKNKFKNSKRIGRGGKRGTYSGKGLKGQKSRAGTHKNQPLIRKWIKKYPKFRGYRVNPKNNVVSLNVNILNIKFENKEKITPKTLVDKKIIKRIKGKIPLVKILGKGKLEKELVIENCLISKVAKEKVEKIGGAII